MFVNQSLSPTFHIAPWRKQIQKIILAAVLLLSAVLSAGGYLVFRAKAVATGFEIRGLRIKIQTMQMENTELEMTYAQISSSAALKSRAQEMGYQPASPDEVKYILVDGYSPRSEVRLAPPRGPATPTKPAIPSAYTESWIDRLHNSRALSLWEKGKGTP